jgi:uncharacterized membrane protein
MLIIVAAVLEFIAWILFIAGISHGAIITWESFMLAGFVLAFVHWGFGWSPYTIRTRTRRAP